MHDPFDREENPLASNSPQAWDRLIETIGPASMLVCLAGHMSPALRRHYSPEDVLQETLLQAWRGRARFEWQGPEAFRRWLLGIARNRILDLAKHEGAGKRGGGRPAINASELAGAGSGGSQWAGPSPATSPSCAAVAKEQALAMERALGALPPELESVIRLRLFEGLTLQETADKLGLGLSAVAHRLRRAAAAYEGRLALETRARRGSGAP